VNIHATTSPAVSTAEWQARVDLAAVYRLVAHYGWDDVIYNRAKGGDTRRQRRTFFVSPTPQKPPSLLTLSASVRICP
jgi:hypothetical protein